MIYPAAKTQCKIRNKKIGMTFWTSPKANKDETCQTIELDQVTDLWRTAIVSNTRETALWLAMEHQCVESEEKSWRNYFNEHL